MLDALGEMAPGDASRRGAGAARRSRRAGAPPAACRRRARRRRRGARRRTRRRRRGSPWRTSSEPWRQRASRLDEPARAQLGVGGVGELAAQLGDGGVEPGVRAGGELDLGEQRLEALGLARDRAQHVERVDVAGALPDRVDRALAVEARQDALLDVAVAAEALERLARRAAASLADPVLARRRWRAGGTARPPRRRRARAAARSTVAASDSTQRSASTFCISGCSVSTRPNAARCAAWCVASATASPHQCRSSRARSRAACARPSR